jgi:nucleoside-diphosphate-sugar epimerase
LKVFLTGATGFIGSHVARQLIGADCEIYCLVRKDSNLWRINDIISSLKMVRGDLINPFEWETLFSEIQPEACINLAWFAEPGLYLEAMQNLDMLTASIKLALVVARSGCPYFLSVGSCFEYDTRIGYLSESTPVRPESIYASSKLAFKLVLEQIARTYGMKAAWVRLFHQFGPFEQKSRLIPDVICSLLANKKQKLTRGEQVRDYLYIEDVASAIAAVFLAQIQGEVNIGSGKPVTIHDLSLKIGTLLNRTELLEFGALPYRPGDPMFICANNQRLMETTGWKPTIDLEEGLLRSIQWWQEQIRSS